jgi:hypothetical protein
MKLLIEPVIEGVPLVHTAIQLFHDKFTDDKCLFKTLKTSSPLFVSVNMLQQKYFSLISSSTTMRTKTKSFSTYLCRYNKIHLLVAPT